MSETAKSVRLDMRISPEDKDLFQRAAEKDGRSMSNWIRDRLLKSAREELGEKEKRAGKDRRSMPKTPKPAARGAIRDRGRHGRSNSRHQRTPIPVRLPPS